MLLARLVQPLAQGRLSGGYLYNAKMAEHGAWELHDVAAQELASFVAALPTSRPVLFDSIWLTEAAADPFVRFAARGGHTGVVLHSFPSMITAAENGEPPRLLPSAFERRTLELLGSCVVPGRHYRDMLVDCPARVLCAEPGIDDAWRAAPRARRGPCRLVSVGAVTPRKGFLDVAELLARRSSRDFRWTVIGSLSVDPGYAARVAAVAHGVGEIELTGQLPPLEVRRRVAQADVLVMPSYDENQPLVLLEAMAASVPAVAYAAGATRHMLEHGREGLIAPIGDRELLSAHLERLIDNEEARHAMAVACWQRQQTIPNWRDAARRAQSALDAAFEAPRP